MTKLCNQKYQALVNIYKQKVEKQWLLYSGKKNNNADV